MTPGPVWEDPRVVEGMRGQLDRRRRALRAGERPLGWKLAFGAEQVRGALGLTGPVVGYLNDATSLPAGASCSLESWTTPVLEAEVAIYLSQDVEPEEGIEGAAAAIAGLGPAIELADVDIPSERLAEVIASDIYHRAVVLAPRERSRPGAEAGDLTAALLAGGTVRESSGDVVAAVGRPVELVAHAAAYLGAFGERLRAGEVLISGSTIPLVDIGGGGEYRFVLDPLGELVATLDAAPGGRGAGRE